jgi:hypothetical protein
MSAVALAEADLTLNSLIGTLRRRQAVEKWCRYGGSLESISVERNSLRKERLRKPLPVVGLPSQTGIEPIPIRRVDET